MPHHSYVLLGRRNLLFHAVNLFLYYDYNLKQHAAVCQIFSCESSKLHEGSYYRELWRPDKNLVFVKSGSQYVGLSACIHCH